MRRLTLLLVALFSLVCAGAAHAQKTKAQLNAEVAANFPDNTIGAITPAILRTTTNDVIASMQQYAGVNAQVGTTYTVLASDYGQLVTFKNSSSVAVTLSSAGAAGFNPFNWYASNLGTGAVTITPASGTINGASSLTLGFGQSVFIVSDGVNWQVTTSTFVNSYVYNATAYGAVCNGVADDTTALANTITAANATGGIVQLPGKGAICMTSASLAPNSGVIIQGSGLAGASPSITTTKFGTTLQWTGVKGGTVISFVDVGVAMGVRDLRINGNQLTPDAVSATGVLIQSNTEPLIENVAVENLGFGFVWQGTVAGVARASGAGGHFRNLRVQNVYDAVVFNGGVCGTNAAVTDFDIFALKIQNYVGSAIKFVSCLDDIKIHGVYIQATQSGSIGINYNPNSVGAPSQPTGTLIDSVTYSGVAGATMVNCNDTASSPNILRTVFAGGGGTITPVKTAGCVLNWDSQGSGWIMTGASIGATPSDGVIVENPTAAAAGAQQFSPRIRLTGQGWKTNATAASQTADVTLENRPVQGAASPTPQLVVNYQTNGGGYTQMLSLTPSFLNHPVGYQINGAAASGHYLRGNGTSYVDGTIAIGDLPASGITANTYGSATQSAQCAFNVSGIATSCTNILITPDANNLTGTTLNSGVTSSSLVSLGNLNSTNLVAAATLSWNSDLYLRRAAAANLAFGQADAASPVAQKLSVQNVVGGTNNTAGANFTIAGSQGTGSSNGGSILLQVAPAGGAGSSQNALATKLTMKGDGSLGMGTETNPQFVNGLTISANTTTGLAPTTGLSLLLAQADTVQTVMQMASWNVNNGNIFSFYNAGGTAASQTDTPGSRTIGVFGFSGRANSAYVSNAARIAATTINAWSATDTSISMSFETTPSGSVSRATAMTVQGSGGVSIGATTDPGIGGLYVNGATVTFNGLATDATHTDRTVCQDTTSKSLFFGSGAAGICLGTSSARFKHDIKPLSVGINELMRLEAVSYKLNADHGDPDKVLYGFTAEQGATVLSQLTGFDASGRPQTFDYMGVVPVLVRAVQQIKADNDSLRVELSQLRQELAR